MSFKLIPAIDIIDGALVRLYKGRYDQQTSYAISPVEMAKRYQDYGLNYIHVVDLNGAKDGRLTNLKTIANIIKSTGLAVQVGGGVRSIDHVKALLDVGVEAVIIGSLFVKNSDLAFKIVNRFPGQVIAGLDIFNGFIAAHGWTETSEITIESTLKTLSNLPLHSIVTTDIKKDGTFEGPNVELYKKMSVLTNHSIVASGGVSTIEDVTELRDLNVKNLIGCIVGKAIIEGRITKNDVQGFL